MIKKPPTGNRVESYVRVKHAIKRLRKPRKKMKVHYASATDKYNTPTWIIERVVELMGAIDLDPCAARKAAHVPAARYYTEADNGLVQPWHGRVFVNPPYGRSIVKWIEKLLAECRCGNVTQAVLLVAARTDTDWWDLLRDLPVILLHGRLKFNDGRDGAPFPSALFYLGPYWWNFRVKFEDKGILYLPYSFAEKEMA